MSLQEPNGINRARKWPRVAVLGCGAWGRNLARNFHALGVLAGVHDRHIDRAWSVATEHGTRVLGFDELLGDKSIEAVSLATPAATHFALARASLIASKHVFVEKPMALDPDHAVELNRIADGRRRTLMVGHLLRYHTAFERLAELVESGELGDISYIAATRLGRASDRDEPSVVWDLAPHDVSMMLALFHDLPTHVTAHGDGSGAPKRSDIAMADLEYADGRTARLHISWRHDKKLRCFVVVGTKATAVFDDGNDWSCKLVVVRTGDTTSNGVPLALTPVEPLAAECRHFLDCVALSRTPRTDGREGHAVLCVLRAIERSIIERTTVEVSAFGETCTRRTARCHMHQV